jgi:microcompartment protein CcmL/EutN
MIETWGFPALVAAADAATKAADVKLVTYQGADAGIVMIYLIGDVASVQAAVAVGTEEAKKVGRLRGSHVIASPDRSVPEMIGKLYRESLGESQSETRTMKKEETAEAEKHAEPESSGEIQTDRSAWQHVSLSELRKIAKSVPNFPLTPQEIQSANKEVLIRYLSERAKERGDH